jgi:S-adenosylmethionine:tRNA ribosyltransferase-isomerase
MKLTDFDYNLPKELIAQFPLQDRSSSRLMVVERKSGKVENRKFSDVLDYFNSGDCLILNDTKVIAARVFGRRLSGAKVEALLLEKVNNNTYRCLIKPSRVKLNEKILFNGGSLYAKLISRDNSSALVQFEADEALDQLLDRVGVMPLPPYIKRDSLLADRKTYQTVYAKNTGAVASPTAGLHFTLDFLDKIRQKGINLGFLTLHVGLGTFKPIKSEDVINHKMEEEEFFFPKETAQIINKTKENYGRVFAVGTTSTRVLETVADKDKNNKLTEKKGKTNLFIYPGYKFKIVDCLLTNFHLPKSTLFLLASAFAGRDLIFKAYNQAIKEKYRFYSYGDAMLIV